MDFKELKSYSILDLYYDTASQFKRFIYNQSEDAFIKGDACRDAISDIEQVEARRNFVKENFINALGGLPKADNELNAKITGVVECHDFKIEKIIFESRPKAYVTANLYLPYGITTPRGAVLFLCGHWDMAKHQPEYQMVCQKLVNAGLVVFAIDPIGQGERFGYYEKELDTTTVRCGSYEHDRSGFQCFMLGDSIARYFVHDAMRAVDYLVTRPEIDSSKIGVTGNSGGGTQTCLMMICDPRIAAAVPVTFLMDRQSYMLAGGAQDCEQVWTGMTAKGFDHEDILLCMVPRPVLVMAARYDFFPIEGTRRSVDRASRFWEMAGKSENIELYEEDSEHAYTTSMAEKAATFFSYHLLGESEKLTGSKSVVTIEPSKLLCTKSGQIRGDFTDACSVYEHNLLRLIEIEQTQNEISFEERMLKGKNWLNQKVFYNRSSCSLNPRIYHKTQVEELRVQMCFWWTQKELFNHAYVFRNYKHDGIELPVTLAVWDGGTDNVELHKEWIKDECIKGRAVMVLDVSGAGANKPSVLFQSRDPLEFYGVNHKLGNDLLWLDDSLAAMRIYDVLRAIDMIEYWKGLSADSLEGFAYGKQGVYIQLAALLDKRIEKVKLENSIDSFRELVTSRHYDTKDIMSIIVPGILKYFDLPDIKDYNSSTFKRLY